MKILLQNRSSCSNSIAGDSVQMRKTGEYLKKLGIEVTFDYGTVTDLTGYTLVHLFNIIPIEDTYRQFINARQYSLPIVLSTVYWDPLEYLQNRSESIAFLKWWNETMPLRREVLAGVNLILPNSQAELDMLAAQFSRMPPAVIIPNAADPKFAMAQRDRFVRRFGISNFLLSVGRISPRKNQLGLIRAAKLLKLPLVLIGPLNDGMYYQECRRESTGMECLFIDALKEDDLVGAYAAARVHALVSWYDTPGLVSLEAALAGCSIVTTDRGCTREYFGNLAHYCQPDDGTSICRALENAWHTPPSPRLKEMVRASYTWDKVAEQTLLAYQQVLK